MASSCIGTFGDFKYSYSSGSGKSPTAPETVWVSRPYDPLDVRDSAPVPRHKTVDSPKSTNELSKEWLPQRQQSLRDMSRGNEESHTYPSLRITRCEEWSTLRQMLPSRGRPVRIEHPRWGTGLGPGPEMVLESPRRHPIITSAMSRYVDEMNLTHRQFKMF